MEAQFRNELIYHRVVWLVLFVRFVNIRQIEHNSSRNDRQNAKSKE